MTGFEVACYMLGALIFGWGLGILSAILVITASNPGWRWT